MENENKNWGLTIVIIILGLLVIGLGVYIVIKNSSQNKEITNGNQNQNPNENTLVSKVNEGKEWIYNAEYNYSVSKDSYVYYNKNYSVKDIIVPYINIKSTAADKANNEMKTIFDKAIEVYKSGLSGKTDYVDECNYTKYVNSSLASVKLTYGAGSTDVVRPEHYTYNFDLKNGQLLSYTDIYKIAGFTSSNIEQSVKTAITSVMKDKMKNANYSNGENFDTYNNKSIDNYLNSVNNNTIKYFLDSNKNLNIIVTLNSPTSLSAIDSIITVKP